MARNAHEVSGYKPRKLPRCSKCNVEFVLVAARYPALKKTIEEWECPKCHKAVARDLLQEDRPPDFEEFLHARCKVLHAEDERRKRTDRK
jgi:hypothetical protein